MPICLAVSMILGMPISCPKRTAMELMLRAKAPFSGMESPLNEPLALPGVQVTS